MGQGTVKIVAATVPGMDGAAYAALDSIGTLIEFQAAVPLRGPTASLLTSVVVIDTEGVGPAMDLVLFDREIASGGNNNAIFEPTVADMELSLGVVQIPTAAWLDFDTGGARPFKIAQVTGINLPIVLPEDTNDLFGRLVSRGTPDWSATPNLVVKLGLIQDR